MKDVVTVIPLGPGKSMHRLEEFEEPLTRGLPYATISVVGGDVRDPGSRWEAFEEVLPSN